MVFIKSIEKHIAQGITNYEVDKAGCLLSALMERLVLYQSSY